MEIYRPEKFTPNLFKIYANSHILLSVWFNYNFNNSLSRKGSQYKTVSTD